MVAFRQSARHVERSRGNTSRWMGSVGSRERIRELESAWRYYSATYRGSQTSIVSEAAACSQIRERRISSVYRQADAEVSSKTSPTASSHPAVSQSGAVHTFALTRMASGDKLRWTIFA